MSSTKNLVACIPWVLQRDNLSQALLEHACKALGGCLEDAWKTWAPLAKFPGRHRSLKIIIILFYTLSWMRVFQAISREVFLSSKRLPRKTAGFANAQNGGCKTWAGAATVGWSLFLWGHKCKRFIWHRGIRWLKIRFSHRCKLVSITIWEDIPDVALPISISCSHIVWLLIHGAAAWPKLLQQWSKLNVHWLCRLYLFL